MRTTFDSQWVGMIARHLADAAAVDRDLDRAAARVAAAVPEPDRAEVAALARLIRDGRTALAPEALQRSPLLGFVELIEGSGAGLDRAQALQRFEAARRDLAPSLLVASKRLGDSAAYALTMGAAFALIIVVYAIYLLPQFVEMYKSFGSELPALTRMVLANEPALFVLVLAVLALGIGAALLTLHARSRLVALRPLDQRLLGRPMVGAIAETYNRAVCLAYASVLRDAGSSAVEARRQAAALTGIPLEGDGSTTADSLAIADALGSERAELEHQFVEAATRLPMAFDAALQRLDAVLKLVLGFAIGLLVIAMYLPIFKLGSII